MFKTEKNKTKITKPDQDRCLQDQIQINKTRTKTVGSKQKQFADLTSK